ncbi:DUF6221 family protein [Saccharothrix sp. HUAS TT1]|uniref:DUF6221 family protein n=1 Tax=unclassified Saccharothrix TaxID=2593673 RepID=UPI00345BD3A8
MNDLVTWLRGQLARDEQTAQAMSHAIEHLESRWSPARLLADVAAKRAILDQWESLASAPADTPGIDLVRQELGHAVLALTLPYRNQRGYRQEWTL